MRGGGENFGQGGGIVGGVGAVTVRQWRGLTPAIGTVGLGENEGVRLHVLGLGLSRRALHVWSSRRKRFTFLARLSDLADFFTSWYFLGTLPFRDLSGLV